MIYHRYQSSETYLYFCHLDCVTNLLNFIPSQPIEEVQREADIARMEALFRAAQANYDLRHPPVNPPADHPDDPQPPAPPPVNLQANPPVIPQAIPAAEPIDRQAEQERRAEAQRLAVQRYWAEEDRRVEEEAWDAAYARAAAEHLALDQERDADWARSAEFWESLELNHFGGPPHDANENWRLVQAAEPVHSIAQAANTGQNPNPNPNVQPQQGNANQAGGYQPAIHGHSSRSNYSPLTAALDESFRTGRKVTLKIDPQNDITHPHFVDR